MPMSDLAPEDVPGLFVDPSWGGDWLRSALGDRGSRRAELLVHKLQEAQRLLDDQSRGPATRHGNKTPAQLVDMKHKVRRE